MAPPRIIAGKARGIHLKPVPGDITRPITDRVKEALFNIIGSDIQDASLLDLFGGTGSVGLEALSRGAGYVRLVDIHHIAVNTIRENIRRTHLEADAEVMMGDAFAYLRRKADRNFDYFYIAPPQYKEMWLQALRELDQNPDWLSEDAWVIVQIDPLEYQELILHNLREFEQRKYGSTLLIFYDRSIST
jgi:16S rRNA (guanine966-N2)-methyltransferase